MKINNEGKPFFLDVPRKFLFSGLALIMILGAAAFNLQAQDSWIGETGSARIYHAEGSDFTITVRGERSVIPREALGSGGLYLERTAVISSGPGTFLEMQFIPSGTLVKMSENSSLIFYGIDENGKFIDLGILYGRIRIIPGNEDGSNTPLVVRSGGITARMDEGDFGIDYFLNASMLNAALQPNFCIYSFRGRAEIFPYGTGGAQAYFGSSQALALDPGEALTVDVSSSSTFAERKPYGPEIVTYWNLHPFSGVAQDQGYAFSAEEDSVPITIMPQIVFDPLPDVSQNTPLAPFGIAQDKPVAKRGIQKNHMLILGLFLTFTAAAVQGVSYYVFDAPGNDIARGIFSAAYVPLGLGMLATLTGILYNPQMSGR